MPETDRHLWLHRPRRSCAVCRYAEHGSLSCSQDQDTTYMRRCWATRNEPGQRFFDPSKPTNKATSSHPQRHAKPAVKMSAGKRGIDLLIWLCVFTVVCVIIISLRFWAAAISRRRIFPDDAMIVFALVSTLYFTIPTRSIGSLRV